MATNPVSRAGAHLPFPEHEVFPERFADVSSIEGNEDDPGPSDETPPPAATPDRGVEPAEAEDVIADGSELDRPRLELIKIVESCDTIDAKEERAKEFRADLKGQEQQRNSERDSLGDDEYLEAIRRSPWYVYREAVGFGSRLAWLLDAGLWTNLFIGLWLQWLELFRKSGEVPIWLYLSAPVAVVAGVLMAVAARGLGRHIALTRLTIPGHVRQTLDRLVPTAGTCVIAAGVSLLIQLGLMFFAPPTWSTWADQLSNLLSFVANILLGLGAGVGAHAAWILNLPSRRDTIDCELEMICRARRYLLRYVRKAPNRGARALALILALLMFSGDVRAAEGVWVWAIDVSDSMDPVQREEGVAHLVETAPERSLAMGARVIQVVKFSDEAGLSEMVWVTVPTAPRLNDCQLARPETPVEKGLMKWSASFAEGRLTDAVATCEGQQAILRGSVAAVQQAFLEQLKAATRITPRADVTTRLVPMLDKLFENPNTIAIDMLTDGIDHSGTAPAQVKIPDRLLVTLVITRPNPRRHRPTVDDVLAAAKTWGAVTGITVTTVSEYPGIWRTLGVR